MTEVRGGWREALEADPLGLATRHQHEYPEPEPSSQKADLVRLAVALAVVIGLGFAAGAGETVLLVLGLVACIVAHEFGHFLTAKAAGMKVTQFFVGFGPRLWSVHKGETEYGVKALPLGGYCRIIGMNNLEEVDPADEARTYRQAPLGRRLSVALAGSTMHFLIAMVVLFAMFFWTGDAGRYLTSPSALPASNPLVEIDSLATGPSPAKKAGFRVGDRIVAMDGQRFANWKQLSDYIQAHSDARVDVTVERNGALVHLFPVLVNRNAVALAGPNAPPLPQVGKKGDKVGFLGVAPSPVIHSSFGQSVSRAGGAWVHASALTIGAFGHLFSFHGISSYLHMLSNQKAADSATAPRFESPVGIVRLVHQSSQSGLSEVLWLVAVINLSLGIFNLIPLFPLDGGHVVVAVYEGVRSRPSRPYRADVSRMLPLIYLGIGLILFLALTAFFLDLRDLTG
ncbi:MAG TPA: M50 family metallopeptidase [Acidimicrobiales bacterium]|nr:M50 family metallopeptidase [Acidimicrobiales bacterium]